MKVIPALMRLFSTEKERTGTAASGKEQAVVSVTSRTVRGTERDAERVSP